MSIEKEVKKSFDFLFQTYDFNIFPNNLDEEMRDYVVLASGRGLKLRFIQDRADFFLDVSSDTTPEKWVGFYEVLGQLKDKGLISDNYKVSNKMNHVKSFLKDYFQVIVENKPL